MSNAFDSANYPAKEPTELVIGDRSRNPLHIDGDIDFELSRLLSDSDAGRETEDKQKS